MTRFITERAAHRCADTPAIHLSLVLYPFIRSPSIRNLPAGRTERAVGRRLSADLRSSGPAAGMRRGMNRTSRHRLPRASLHQRKASKTARTPVMQRAGLSSRSFHRSTVWSPVKKLPLWIIRRRASGSTANRPIRPAPAAVGPRQRRIHPTAPRRLTISHEPLCARMGRVLSLSSRPTLGASVSSQAYTGVFSSVRYQAGSIAR